MSKRNPFRMIERVGNIVGNVLFGVLGVGSFVIVGVGVSLYYEWGWWGLLLIPGVPIGLAVLIVIVAALRFVTDSIHDAWLMAKWRWDDRHREDGE
ncbi:hypothetical protein [Microbacterium sp. NPDC089696]|uniref:hypothetical protein n=1 Tax=Microbacterium sp. NPDC089696 TaxID=3364199 RepID=UPI003803DF57